METQGMLWIAPSTGNIPHPSGKSQLNSCSTPGPLLRNCLLHADCLLCHTVLCRGAWNRLAFVPHLRVGQNQPKTGSQSNKCEQEVSAMTARSQKLHDRVLNAGVILGGSAFNTGVRQLLAAVADVLELLLQPLLQALCVFSLCANK